MNHFVPCRWVAIALLHCCAISTIHAEETKPITFDDHVAPIFKRHCQQCHGESKQKAGLDLSNYASTKKGGSGGVVVVPGQASASSIMKAITAGNPAERMPPDNDPLPKDQIATIKSWIDTGLRQNAGSAVVSTRTPGFTPSTKTIGRSAMPDKLPQIVKPKTIRPFPVLALASSPGASLAAAASYGSIDFLDPASHGVLGSVAFPEGEPHTLRFSQSGSVLLAAGGRPVQNGVAVLFDVKSGKRLAEFGNETDTVIAADLSPDERFIALGGSSRVVKVYSTKDASLLHSLVKHTDWVTTIAFSPDGKLLATGDRIGNIHLWDPVSGGVILPLSEHKGAVKALSWRSDGKVLASCSEDGGIIWWDITKGWPVISKPDAHPPVRPAGVFGKIPNGVLDASFGPNGELVTCGRDGNIRLWANDGRELKNFPFGGEKNFKPNLSTGIRVLPTRVALTFDGAITLAGDSSGTIHYWPNTPAK